MKVRDTMPKRGNLVKAYKTSGQAFFDYCNRKAVMISYNDWEISEGRYAGEHRENKFWVDGLEAHVEFHNGEIVAYGYKLLQVFQK